MSIIILAHFLFGLSLKVTIKLKRAEEVRSQRDYRPVPHSLRPGGEHNITLKEVNKKRRTTTSTGSTKERTLTQVQGGNRPLLKQIKEEIHPFDP